MRGQISTKSGPFSKKRAETESMSGKTVKESAAFFAVNPYC